MGYTDDLNLYEVFSKDNLKTMYLQCSDYNDDYLNDAIQHIEKWKRLFSNAENNLIYYLRQNLLGFHFKKEDKESLKQLKKTIKEFDLLSNKINDIPDFFEEPEVYEHVSSHNLRVGLLDELFWTKPSNDQLELKLSDNNYIEWMKFKQLFLKYNGVFQYMNKNIDCDISDNRKPRVNEGLSEWIVHVAYLFEKTTKRKFTVCEYGDIDWYTEGMRFAKKSLEKFSNDYILSNCYWLIADRADMLDEMDVKKSYQESNFHNSCFKAQKELKRLRNFFDKRLEEFPS